MKILLSAYACLPDAGTEPGFGWNWAIHLAERGHEVHVLTRPWRDLRSPNRHNQREAIEAALGQMRASGARPLDLHFHFVDLGQAVKALPVSPLFYLAWQNAALRAARTLQRAHAFDIVHHVTYGSVHGASQLWRLGVPFVFGPAGGGQVAPPAMLPYFGPAARTERLRTLLTRALRFSPIHRACMRHVRKALATNSDTLQLLRRLGSPDVQFFCDTGLPNDFFAPQPRRFEATSPLRLLWVGRLLPRKALPLALDALAGVKAPVHLTVVGDGLGAAEVARMIESRALQDRVTWRGRLPWAEVRAAYAGHDAFLFTSLRDSLGSQLLESLALGLPIITLDLGGARDLVPEGAGYKVGVSTPRLTARALADAIEAYAALTPEARSRMSEVGWAFAHTQTWPKRAEHAEQLYREIAPQAAKVPSAAS